MDSVISAGKFSSHTQTRRSIIWWKVKRKTGGLGVFKPYVIVPDFESAVDGTRNILF